MVPTPVTILTGYLGSGKTTLLNHVLRAPHGHRIAVIENEFGEAGIDNELLMHEPGEQIIEMNNGCICCTVRGDLARLFVVRCCPALLLAWQPTLALAASAALALGRGTSVATPRTCACRFLPRCRTSSNTLLTSCVLCAADPHPPVAP